MGEKWASIIPVEEHGHDFHVKLMLTDIYLSASNNPVKKKDAGFNDYLILQRPSNYNQSSHSLLPIGHRFVLDVVYDVELQMVTF
jgi:hypothetical protein